MNNRVNIGNDTLGKYLNRERIEKAPEGFSENIMTLISIEKSPERFRSKFRASLMVPVISALITSGLIIFSLIFTTPEENNVLTGVSKYLNDISIKLPEIKIDALSGLSIPVVVIYICIGFLALSLFDRALHRLFRRDRR